MKTRTTRFLTAVTIALALGGAAQADVIFDSTIGGNSLIQGGIIGPDFSGSYPTPAWYYGQSFVTDGNENTLKSVVLDLQSLGGSGFSVDLYDATGSNNLPGPSSLKTLSGSTAPGTGLNTYTGEYSLSANTTYWIVAIAQEGRVNWIGSSNAGPAVGTSIGDMHVQVSFFSGTSTWGPTTSETLHMKVNVTPEPATLGLLVLGGLAILKRRRMA